MSVSRETFKKGLGLKLCSANLVAVCEHEKCKRMVGSALALFLAIVLQGFFLLIPANGAAAKQDQAPNAKKLPLGSLSSTGEVYVNEKPVPVESTVFVGDTVRTGANSAAVFTMTGNGTLKIGPQTQVVLTGDPQFAAELQSGAAVIDSLSGPPGIKLRVGEYVVVPAVRSRVTSAKIERQADGTFLVTCLGGDISTLALQGTAGRLLEATQSVSLTPSGQMLVQKQNGGKSTGSGITGPLSSRKGWALLSVAGAGAGAAALVLGHGGKPPVSPSGP